MSNLLEVIEQLAMRLPELELRLSKIGQIPWTILPRGLFCRTYHDTVEASSLVAEIKRDLSQLTLHPEPHSALFLVQKINQKMNVLLSLCRNRKHKPAAKFDMNQLMTRQQWLKALAEEVIRLEAQEKSLQCTLEKQPHNTSLSTSIQHELNEIRQRINAVKLLFPA